MYLGFIFAVLRSVPFQNLRFFNFKALDPTFVLALEQSGLKLQDKSFGIRPSIYILMEGYILMEE